MAFSEELRKLAERVSNWGRWGDDDQAGTGNLLTPEAARRGAACVVDGAAFALALPLLGEGKGVQVGQPAGRLNAVLTFTTMNERDPMAPGIWTGCDDQLTMSTSAGTHVDALSHVAYDGLLYNGRSTDTIGAASGATWCGAEQLRPINTRAILLDVPRTLGIDFMEPGQAVTADVLDAAIERAGVTPEPGDVVLVRTGDVRHYLSGDRRRYAVGKDWQLPGIGVSCVEWFARHDLAGVFSDTYSHEVFPPETGNWDDLLAVHLLCLRDLGMVQGQNWNLEALADECAAHPDRPATAQLIAVPEPLVGATSTPVAPLAIR